jgi:hypothetical protein
MLFLMRSPLHPASRVARANITNMRMFGLISQGGTYQSAPT